MLLRSNPNTRLKHSQPDAVKLDVRFNGAARGIAQVSNIFFILTILVDELIL